ncbi:hypothetical protein PC116_g34869 [Phytophthora cactorum]|nr:hypothetical protein PC116_g34869 [Phytophthora cactorum]
MDLLNRVAGMIRALESTLMDFAIWHIEVFDLVQRANWLMEAFRVTVQQIKAGWVEFAEKFQGRISQLEEFESNLK